MEKSLTHKIRFSSLEMGRGLAATLVVFHHASTIAGQDRYFGTPPFHDIFHTFHVGVDFFFVLSGFIISWVHWQDIGNRSRLPHYAARRFTRVLPAYWAMSLPLMVAYRLFPSTGTPSQHELGTIMTSLILAPYPAPPVLPVAWTLVYEMTFYTLFATVIFFGRRAFLAFAGWSILIFATIVMGQVNNWPWGADIPWPASYLLSDYNLEFLAGILCTVIIRRAPLPKPGLVLAFGTGGFITLMLFLSPWASPLLYRAGFGLTACLCIIGLVQLEASGKLHVGRFARQYGSASYSIYLAHGVAQSFFLSIGWRFMSHLSANFATVILVAFGLLAGFAFHYAIAEPITSLARRSLKSFIATA